MRNLTPFLAVCCLFTACSTVRPATVVRTTTGNSAANSSSPEFIDNIKISPSATKPATTSNPYLANNAPLDNTGHFFSVNIEQLNSLQFKYAILVDVAVEEMYNLKMLQFIEDWYGTRYRYGGSTKQGVDCSFFTSNLMMSVFGISIPRTASEQYEQSIHITRNELHTGDLVFFNTRGGISHVGVYLSNNKFVHASTSSGVMISSLNDDYYGKKFIGAGRPRIN